jgi:pullulanase
LKPLIIMVGLLVLCASPGAVADTTFRVAVPDGTPPDAKVYIAGDFQSWQPGNPDYQLEKKGENLWQITLPLVEGQALQYKFTLGDWDHVEKGPEGQEMQNRLHKVTGGETLNLKVFRWAQGEKKPSTRSGNLQTLTVPGFLNDRRVWIYLPPGYENEPEKRYPVLYMMDGQNVFDDATSFAGEWKVDETLEELIPAGRVAPLIVVAVDNGGDLRGNEYTPWPSEVRRYGGGGGEHLQIWVDTLLPYINANFRTLTGPQNTGLAGSSFGGLMTLYGAFWHPEVFGRCGAFSPSIMFAGNQIPDKITGSDKPDVTLYMDMGTRETGNLKDGDGNGLDDNIDILRGVASLLADQGFVGGWDLMVVEGDGHRHNESYWARRFPAAVEFLFPGGS